MENNIINICIIKCIDTKYLFKKIVFYIYIEPCSDLIFNLKSTIS